MLLYIIRAVAYDVPYFGGRARGRRRPRAPSLKERPNGRKRTFSIGGGVNGFVGNEDERRGGGSVRDEAGVVEEEEEDDDISVEGGYMVGCDRGRCVG